MNDFIINESIAELPVIPLRGLVVFPKMILHFDVGRKKSIEALKDAMQEGQRVFLVCQKDASIDEPTIDDLYDIGVICNVKQMIRMPNSDNLRVVVEGVCRATLISFTHYKPFISAAVDIIEENDVEESSREDVAYQRIAKKEFENYFG